MNSVQLYLATSPSSKLSKDVLIDIGASSHMTPHQSWFVPDTYMVLLTPVKIYLGDDSVVNGIGIGNIQLQ